MSLTLEIPPRAPDWQDCHEGALMPPETPARAVFERGLTHAPGWVRPAMGLRNLLVAPLGLITEKTADTGVNFLARLPVRADRPDIFETGLTDRHLTFALRVETRPGHVAVRTLIWFHSAFGRLYLRLVQPAHNAILGRIVRQLGVQA